MRKLVLCVFLMLTATLMLWGQTNTGVITGTATDPSGAVIPKANVKITNQATNVSLASTTNQGGYFTSVPIKPGTYSVTVTAPGFKMQTQSGIALRVQDRLNLNFKMAVGEASQTVEVTNATPTIDTQTSSLGQVMSSKTITDMPLNGRSYLELAALSAGVVQQSVGRNTQGNGNGGADSGLPGQVSFASNGTRSRLNNFVLDGIDNNSNDNGGLVINTQVDALQEFKIQTNSYSAEFGRSGGAVINAITKSGTNSYHGVVFEFNRNNGLDARNFFQRTGPKSSFTENQFGATLGGFIIKDKLFWFGDYQGTAINQPTPLFSTVPSAAEKRGDFTGDPTIYDPTTTTLGTDGKYHRESFATEYGNGNKIPSNMIDPIAHAFVNLYPAANVPGATKNNYSINPNAPYRANQGDFRGDWDASQRNQGFFRYSLGHVSNTRPQRFPGRAQGQSGSDVSIEYMGASLGQTHIFSPTIVNEFRLGFSYYGGSQEIPSYGIHYPPADLTIPGVPLEPNTAGLAQFSPTGYTGVGMSGYSPTYLSTEERQVTDALTIAHGKQSIVIGFEMRWSQFNLFQVPDPNGALYFTGQFTQDPATADGGIGLADALLGIPLSSDYNTQNNVQNRQHIPSAFFQDNYRVTPTFTLNLGLRYDYFQPIVSKHNRQSNFNYTTGQLEVAGQDGNSRALTVPDKLNFAPRIGFAKTLPGNTVVSAGGGIFWSGQEVRESTQLAYNEPFEYNPTFISDGLTPLITVSKGFPPFSKDQQTDPGVTSIEARQPTPRYSEWNLSIQHALPGRMSLELAYAGSKGTHLQADLNYNQVKVPGPGSIQARRPYPNYGSFNSLVNRANSKYNAFQAKLEKQTGHGLYFLSSFTWGKVYDDQVAGYPGPQNTYDPSADEGLSDLNQTFRWVLSYYYLLPIGNGQRLLGGAGRALNAVVGGWHLGGIYTLGSGFPFSPAMGYDPSNTGSQGAQRADQILPDGNLPRSQRSITQWFNPAAYAVPAQYTFGNAGRNTLIGPDTNDWDLSLVKNFPVWKSQYAEFRAEFFNVLNHPNFAQPDGTITDGPGAFGVVTGTGIDNREIQLAVKYYF